MVGWSSTFNLSPRLAVAVLATLLVLPAAAQPPRTEAEARELVGKLELKEGSIALGNSLAELKTAPNFAYLDPKSSEILIADLWGNPKGAGERTLGTIVPSNVDLIGPDSWAVIVTFEKTGYVSDSDAAAIDYDALLKDMQEATKEANEERVKNGYPSVTLVGWARKPVYDAAAHKLYWAKRLRFGHSPQETLNYNIRVLGRNGVFNLNVVAGMEHLQRVEGDIGSVLGMVTFKQGNRYEEFDPKIDEVAAYGIAGLVAGGILAKTGFFKALLIGLLASKKLLGGIAIAGAAGGWAVLKRFFARRA